MEFRVGERVLVAPEEGEWAVSLAALNLLRTLSRPHELQNRDGEQLFPCCGHSLYPSGDEVISLGCPAGIDLGVSRVGDEVTLLLGDGTMFWSEWSRRRAAAI